MKNDRIPMIQIDDTIISIDCLSEKFCCDLDACKGECCIEGDAGAPVELDEVAELEEALPVVWPWLSASAQAVIDRKGVVYTDEDGDLVTSIVNGKDCVFMPDVAPVISACFFIKWVYDGQKYEIIMLLCINFPAN